MLLDVPSVPQIFDSAPERNCKGKSYGFREILCKTLSFTERIKKDIVMQYIC